MKGFSVFTIIYGQVSAPKLVINPDEYFEMPGLFKSDLLKN